MNVNNIGIRVEKDGSLPGVAPNINILLVDHDRPSLLSLASQFERQLYKVTTTESGDVALSLFKAEKYYYNIVIAGIGMPDMEIKEFVHEIHLQNKNIPVILMAEDITTDSAMEALGYGVRYLLSKLVSHYDIATLWQHIYKVTGEMPSSTDTIDIEKFGNPSNADCAERNKKERNSKRKLINTDIENMKGKNQIVEDSNSSKESEKDDGCNFKKSRVTWNCLLHEKFLRAVNILGEKGAQPKTILSMMKEPGLTLRHISSHLQKYRDRKRNSVNLHNTAGPVMPTVQPAAQGQTSGAANLNYMAARRDFQIPRSTKFVGYTLDYVNKIFEPLNYSSSDTVNAITTHGGFQIPEGSGVETNENPGASYSHVIPASGHVIPASGYRSNGFQTPNQEPAGATRDMIPATGHPSKGLQALNQKSAGDVAIGMNGMENAGNRPNLINNDNFGAGTSTANPMPVSNYINQIIQEFEASGVKFWD